MRRTVWGFLAVGLLFCGCGIRADETDYIKTAAQELISVLWDVDYRTFTPAKSTAFAKEYYDAAFLDDYLSDVTRNSGAPFIVAEKLVSRVTATEICDIADRGFDGAEYKTVRIRSDIEIKNYQPAYPEDCFFEQGREYTLVYTVYFMREDGNLKLTGFDFMPEGEPFLPKRADNVALNGTQQRELKCIARNYAGIRYALDYRTYDADSVYAFYRNTCSETFLLDEGIDMTYLEAFQSDLELFRIVSEVVSVDIGRLPGDKAAVGTLEGTMFYYPLTMTIAYDLKANDAYYAHAQVKKGGTVTITETLYFDIVQGNLKIVYAEYE